MGGEQSNLRGRWIALVTGVFSIAIALIYLILIIVLDSRGPMLPPPPEALGVVAVVFDDLSEGAQQLFSWLIP